MEQQKLEEKLKEKEKYLEQIKGELMAVVGQINLLKELLQKPEEK